MHKHADLALETYKLKVITEINIVNSLLTKFYNYSQRRAIELGEALIRTFEVGNQYADKYRELIERGYDPEGEVKDRILKAQAALRKHWGIQVAIPLPEIPAPPAAAASASQVEEVA